MRLSHAGRKKDHEPKDYSWCRLHLIIPQKTEYTSQGLYDVVLAILQNIQNEEFMWNFAALFQILNERMHLFTKWLLIFFWVKLPSIDQDFAGEPGCLAGSYDKSTWAVSDPQQQPFLTTCTNSCSNRLTLGSVVVCTGDLIDFWSGAGSLLLIRANDYGASWIVALKREDLDFTITRSDPPCASRHCLNWSWTVAWDQGGLGKTFQPQPSWFLLECYFCVSWSAWLANRYVPSRLSGWTTVLVCCLLFSSVDSGVSSSGHFTEVTEWLGLEGNSGDHLVQHTC